MPFPENAGALEKAGYKYLRTEVCPECKVQVEVFLSPGKREVQLNPMWHVWMEAVQHFKTCKSVQSCTTQNEPQGEVGKGGTAKPSSAVQQEQQGASTGQEIKLYGVTDPNGQLLAVGFEPVEGTLRCRFKTATWDYAKVPENVFMSLKRVPFAYSYFTKVVKNKFQARKVT